MYIYIYIYIYIYRIYLSIYRCEVIVLLFHAIDEIVWLRANEWSGLVKDEKSD